MNCDEARAKMEPRLAGTLPAAEVRELDAHLAECADCAEELRLRREEEELLGTALSELKPSASVRIRLAEACAQMRQRAERMAELLPERGWRVVRWVFSAVAVAAHILVVMLYVGENGGLPKAVAGLPDARVLIYWFNALGALVFLLLTLAGRHIAELNAFIGGGFSRQNTGPTRLEILIIQLLGMVGLAVTVVVHVLLWLRALP